jgi:glycosyltransferase involved in cell wall biosynthesis
VRSAITQLSMRILHVIDSLDPAHGGPPAVVLNLAAAQLRRGDEVTVVSGCPPGQWPLVAESIAALGVQDRLQVVLVGGGWLESVVALRARRILRLQCKRHDIVQVHGLWQPMLARAVLAGRRRRLVVTPHGMISRYGLAQKPWRKHIALLLFWRRALQHASLVQALSEAEAVELRHFLPGARVHVVPNGIDPREYPADVHREAFHELHPELGGQPYVLFLARLDRIKGLDLLVDAFARVAANIPGVRLVIAGPDYGLGALIRRMIDDLRLRDRVSVLGPIRGAEKRAALAGAVCLCQPSRYETFSLSILEAMASGVPVVVSRECRQGPELVETGAGTLVPLEAPAIAGAIAAYVRDPQRQRAAGAAARRLVLQCYTWDGVAARLAANYAELGTAVTAETGAARS